MFHMNYEMPDIHSLNFFIDTFQGTKRSLTNSIIKDPVLNKAANEFITSQTSFAKMLVNNYTNISKYFVDTQTNVLFPKKEDKNVS